MQLKPILILPDAQVGRAEARFFARALAMTTCASGHFHAQKFPISANVN
jgi:hypothetical protein